MDFEAKKRAMTHSATRGPAAVTAGISRVSYWCCDASGDVPRMAREQTLWRARLSRGIRDAPDLPFHTTGGKARGDRRDATRLNIASRMRDDQRDGTLDGILINPTQDLALRTQDFPFPSPPRILTLP